VNLQLVLAVAVGGAIGSVARYLAGIGSGRLFGMAFPWGTLILNVTGGYTTFSTFSLDAFYLMERGEAVAAGAYMILSVVLSVGALIGAMQVVRALP
jgi:CrcB protein